ncbi:hypothetical protein APICBIBUN_17402, partial [Acinetobacter pittii 42F]
MATNWNAVLANINNASDILAILRKVLSLLDGKVDLTKIDEIIEELTFMQSDVNTALGSVNSALNEFDVESQAAILNIITSGNATINDLQEAINLALAAGAGSAGWTTDLVVDGAETQKIINDLNIQVVKSKSALEVLKPRIDGQVVLMTGYHENQFQGGDHFKYDKSQSTVNNGVTIINGWVKQFFNTELTVSACGAKFTDTDHSASLEIGVSFATSLKRKLVIDFDLNVSKTTEMNATLNIEGNGAAVQYSRSITALADIPIFTVKAGFGSESSRFTNLMFKAANGGTAAAFRSTSNGYLSQCTFDHCVFDRSLRYGIDAN